MREIKFRAYHKGRNEWVDIDKHFSFDEKGELYQTDFKQIELMQYTGLKDKNGKEIYEGDIVKHESYHFPGTVKFGKGTYDSGVYRYQGFYIESVGQAYHPNRGWYRSGLEETDGTGGWIFNCEVIGNIYENKDLLV